MKKNWIILLGIMIFAILLSVDCREAKAGSVMKIGNSDSFQCDITNDGGMDNLRIYTLKDQGYIYDYSIYINGKKAYDGYAEGSLRIDINYLRVTSRESYLNVYGTSDSEVCTFSILLKYKRGKLKKVNTFSYGTYSTQVVKINKKKLVVESSSQPGATGHLMYHIVYKKKNGKWIKKTNAHKVSMCWCGEGDNEFISTKRIKMYKKSACKGARYKIKAGKRFKLLKVKLKKDEYQMDICYGYFKCGRKKGWIALDDYETSRDIFRNVQLVG